MLRLISEHTFVVAAAPVASRCGSKPQQVFMEVIPEILGSFLENLIFRLQFCSLELQGKVSVLQGTLLVLPIRSLRLEFRIFLLERSNISVLQLNLVSALLSQRFEDGVNMAEDVVKCPVDSFFPNE
jgi:hypothetical protein